MSDVSWDSSQDIEAPTDDAVEQRQPLPGEDDEPPEPTAFELPEEANEADAAEQYWEISGDDEDYR